MVLEKQVNITLVKLFLNLVYQKLHYLLVCIKLLINMIHINIQKLLKKEEILFLLLW